MSEEFRKECHISFWERRVEIRDSPESVRVAGIQYHVGPEGHYSAACSGHYGASFYIHFDDGRHVHTRNLWRNGDIPPEYREQLPDNASFVSREEFKGTEIGREAVAPSKDEMEMDR